MRSIAFLLALALLFGAPQAARAAQIDRAQVENLFASIKAKTPWDTSKALTWGYFFLDPAKAPLEKAGADLQKQGYRVVEIRVADKDKPTDPDVWQLHIEKVEVHTVASLDARNQAFYKYAAAHGIKTYDGMIVGPAPP